MIDQGQPAPDLLSLIDEARRRGRDMAIATCEERRGLIQRLTDQAAAAPTEAERAALLREVHRYRLLLAESSVFLVCLDHRRELAAGRTKGARSAIVQRVDRDVKAYALRWFDAITAKKPTTKPEDWPEWRDLEGGGHG